MRDKKEIGDDDYSFVIENTLSNGVNFYLCDCDYNRDDLDARRTRWGMPDDPFLMKFNRREAAAAFAEEDSNCSDVKWHVAQLEPSRDNVEELLPNLPEGTQRDFNKHYAMAEIVGKILVFQSEYRMNLEDIFKWIKDWDNC